MFKTEFVNLRSGEIFRLPTSYSDRVEACVCGQNYCRDRQQEDGTKLFFRVVVDLEKHDDYYDEDCEGECECCNLCCEDEDEEDSEEPDWRDYCNDEEFINYFINLMKKA
jgi:hypothetical protein